MSETGEGFKPFFLELDSHLNEVEGTQAWQLMTEALKGERQVALELCLYEEKLSREYYQGYVRALEYLIALPANIRAGAQAIRDEQDEEDKVAVTPRLFQGGGENA